MKKFYLITLLFLCHFFNAQQVININEPDDGKKILKKATVLTLKNQFLNEAERVREFKYNTRIRKMNPGNKGDTLLLDFFNDKKYKAVIETVTQSKDGITGITARITNTLFGYSFISVSSEGISITAEIPELNEKYLIRKIKGTTYLSEHKISVLKKNQLACSDESASYPDVGIEKKEILYQNSSIIIADVLPSCVPNINENITLDVMVVYTPAAKTWAATNSTSIDNVINQAMQQSNLVMQNSLTGVTLNLVYKHLTNYTETDSSVDLNRIRTNNDGYMDEVHTLRNQYKIDLVIFLPMINYTGGQAGLLSSEKGDRIHAGFSLSRVQQADWSYTMVHEIGHNMGAHHHKDQSIQPGPGLYSYSSGWRGINNSTGERYATVMTYEGYYFPDKKDHITIPYFSTPDLIVNEIPIGDAITANNVLTIKKTKHITSKYSQIPVMIGVPYYTYKTYGDTDPNITHTINSGNLISGDNIVIIRKSGENFGLHELTARIYRKNTDVTCEYDSQINIGRLIIEKRQPSLSITTKTITYTGNNLYIDPATISNLVGVDILPITYGYVKSGSITEYALNTGTYYVFADTYANENYYSARSNIVEFIVNKAKPTITINDKSAAHTGEPISIDTPELSGSATAKQLPLIIEYEGIGETSYTKSQTAPSAIGTYKVTISTIGDSNHLSASTQTTLVIDKNMGIDDVTVQNNKSLKISPNPVHSVIKVYLPSQAGNKDVIYIYNLTGKLILKESVTVGDTVKEIDFSNYNTGTYILKYKNESIKMIKY